MSDTSSRGRLTADHSASHASVLMGVILIAALLLRANGVWHGYPRYVSEDERPVLTNAIQFLTQHTLEPGYYSYPSFYAYIVAGAMWVKYALGGFIDLGDLSRTIEMAWAICRTGIALLGRVVSIAAGTALVSVTYLLGARGYGPRVGLSAALFACVSVLLVDKSKYAFPDMTMALLAAGAAYFLVRVATTDSRGAYLAAGFLAGLATSTKYNAALVLLGFPVAHWRAVREHRKPMVNVGPLLSLVGFGVGFLAGSPYWLVSPEAYLDGLQYEMGNMQFSLKSAAFPWWGMISGLVSADLRLEAARWIERNVPEGAVIVGYWPSYCPPIWGQMEQEELRKMVQDGGEYPAATARLERILDDMVFYRTYELSYDLPYPDVPPSYSGKVDLADPKTVRIFRKQLLGYEGLKRMQADYVLLPEQGFARFMSGDVPPAGTAAEYYFMQHRERMLEFFDSTSGRYRVVKKFESSDRQTGSPIWLLRVL